MIKYRTFSLRHQIKVKKKSIFGEYEESQSMYKHTNELYDAVAKFANECGFKLVTITGTPYGDNSQSHVIGDVVVWYRE